jgi:CRISPR-associated endonuclease/helicase Cas3
VFFKRVNYRYEGLLSDESLVEQVKDQHQVLCIVNSRKQAQNIFLSLPENTRFHLSTAMVPIHRREVLSVIRNKLMTDEPCMVISTSLIEAGVDIDFPCVYRAIAGLDSIIQAAGRCNREGKRPVDQSTIHIFDTDTKSPSGMNQNIAAARHVISQHEDISSPKAIEDYFNFLLYTLKDKAALDNKEILRLIREDMAFKTVSEQFQLIENSTITVYIPYGKGKELINELLKNGPNKRLMRELGQYSVSVYPVNYASLDAVGAMQKITVNTAVLINPVYYDINRGLSLSPEGGEALFG